MTVKQKEMTALSDLQENDKKALLLCKAFFITDTQISF